MAVAVALTSIKHEPKVKLRFTGLQNLWTKRQEITETGRSCSNGEMLVFSVTPFKIDQNKNQNRSIDKVQNLGNERR